MNIDNDGFDAEEFIREATEGNLIALYVTMEARFDDEFPSKQCITSYETEINSAPVAIKHRAQRVDVYHCTL